MRKRVLAAAMVALGVMSLSGCALIGDLLEGESAVRDSQTEEITEGGDIDVFTVKVGDCFNDQDGTEITDIPVVPCSEPHDNEVYYEFAMSEGDFPGDETITAEAETTCADAFADFVGIAYDESALYLTYLTPTEDGWNRLDDRKVQCVVYESEVMVTGTLEGAGR